MVHQVPFLYTGAINLVMFLLTFWCRERCQERGLNTINLESQMLFTLDFCLGWDYRDICMCWTLVTYTNISLRFVSGSVFHWIISFPSSWLIITLNVLIEHQVTMAFDWSYYKYYRFTSLGLAHVFCSCESCDHICVFEEIWNNECNTRLL